MTKQMALAGNPASTSDPSRPDRERGLPDHELFVPKDEHCGIWHNPPNADCASSFGDNGTTASVSCHGALIHLSQYLAVGPSGSFTLDHEGLDEPYFVRSRSETLDQRSKWWGKERIRIHVDNSQPDLPPAPSVGSVLEIKEIPRVKWVNWRWPRYEYLLPDSNFTATCQWLVYKNIVLQQLTFRKPQDKPRQCFATVPISYDPSLSLIRDTDYLDATNRFNDVFPSDSDYSNAYTMMHGPNRCGRVLVHKLSDETPNPDQKPREQIDQGARQDGTPRNSDERSHISQAAGSPSDENRVSRSGNSEGHDNAIASVPLHPGQQPVEANQDPAPGFVSSGPKATVGMEEKEGPPRKSTTAPQHRIPQSIAAVTTIFVNGEVLPESPPPRKLELPNQGVLEVVYAHKLVHLPGHEVDWRNLIVSAQDADVNRILKEETHRLWGPSSGPSNSLPNLGLSLRDPSKDKTAAGNWGEQAQQANDSEGRKVPRDESKPGETSGTAAAPPPETSGLEPNADVPEGTPNNSSATNHIEYLTWRHLEHILSVCAIPLSPPSLLESGTSKVENEAIALTCGDLSGHRVCTSASL